MLKLGRGASGQDRPLTMVSAGPRVAAGTIPNYGELGGALTLFHPGSGTHEVNRNIVEDQSVTALAHRDGLVYGGTSIHGGLSSEPTQDEAELFVWDTRRDRLVRSTVVVPGAEVIHALAFDDAGRLFRFDPDTLEFTTLLAGGARNSAVDDDGAIYFADATNVYRYLP